ncbi:N-acetylmuramoyl-L-alanine amidase [Nitrosomonas sp.]|uniref:N-acetylmuramoyl-L-alanine amidase n=1 Tax=Nitrosomonas sp. TaxID=42353 RepID=UPI0025F92A34|nr:N-acetylmuramoyl-L-alanine amidase [Nitrosomonas sp.]MBV6448509.1 hypothetical protein [Nitrosomonas sp.]
MSVVHTRREWGARLPVDPDLVVTPVSRVFLHHPVTNPTADARADMRVIETTCGQRFGIFCYSYCTHPVDGSNWEGAGDHVGAHTGSANPTSFAISAIGNWDRDTPTHALIDGIVECFAWLVETGRARADAELVPHRSVYATACPGRHLVAHLGEIRSRIAEALTGSPAPSTGGEVFTMSEMQTLARWHQDDRVVIAAAVAKLFREQDARWALVLPAVIAKTAEVTAKAVADGTEPDTTAVTRAVEAALAEAPEVDAEAVVDELSQRLAD